MFSAPDEKEYDCYGGPVDGSTMSNLGTLSILVLEKYVYVAMTELDALAIRRSDVPVSEADYQSLLSAADEVRALAQAQQAELDRIAGMVSAL